LAHQIEIIAACQDPEIIEQVDHPTVIGLVDGPRFLNRFQYTNHTIQLMEEQLSVCHDIVMNKMDLIDNHAHDIDEAIHKINPTASKYFTTYADMDMNQISSVANGNQMKINSHVQIGRAHV